MIAFIRLSLQRLHGLRHVALQIKLLQAKYNTFTAGGMSCICEITGGKVSGEYFWGEDVHKKIRTKKSASRHETIPALA